MAAGVPLSPQTNAALAELKAFHDVENTWTASLGDAVETLDRLRGAGLKVVIVSNANGRLRHLLRSRP